MSDFYKPLNSFRTGKNKYILVLPFSAQVFFFFPPPFHFFLFTSTSSSFWNHQTVCNSVSNVAVIYPSQPLQPYLRITGKTSYFFPPGFSLSFPASTFFLSRQDACIKSFSWSWIFHKNLNASSLLIGFLVVLKDEHCSYLMRKRNLDAHFLNDQKN